VLTSPFKLTNNQLVSVAFVSQIVTNFSVWSLQTMNNSGLEVRWISVTAGLAFQTMKLCTDFSIQ